MSKSLTAARTQKIKLVFSPTVSQVRVKFTFDQPGFQITGTTEPIGDCTFSFDFTGAPNKRKQPFVIWMSSIDKLGMGLLIITCQDKYGRKIPPSVRRRLVLKPRPKFPERLIDSLQIFAWAFDQLIHLNRYVFFPIIAALLLTTWLMLPHLIPETDRISFYTKFMITIHWWPAEYQAEKKEQFLKTRKLTDNWSYPDPNWTPVQGEGTDPNDGAVVIKGPNRAVFTNLENKSFYDFDTEFKIMLKPGTNKAAWLFRFDPKKGTGYLFELVRSGNLFYLDGSTYPEKTSLGDHDDHRVNISGCCNDDDVSFRICAKVKDYHFNHSIKLEPKVPVAGAAYEFQLGTYIDEAQKFRYGTFGLFEPETDNEMQVEFWYVYPKTISHQESSHLK